MFLCLTINTNYLDQNHWFIDDAFAVHLDMRSHTGAYITFGKGMVDGSAKTQNMNTTSLTEVEVVPVSKNMPALKVTQYFLEAQGYPPKPTTILQDNTSAMLLKFNGRVSSSRHTRHINI